MPAKILAFSIAAILLPACSSMSESERFERQADLIEAREEFMSRKESCNRNGGSMKIETRSTKLQKERHTAQDYRMAYCR